ncbi:MAG: hypothetical protein QM753_15835 [Thermomicrobiales bacterium]
MQVWKKSLIGATISLAMVGGALAQVGAQEPASITGYVSICSADLTSCENVAGANVYFDVNDGPDQIVQTNADGNASLEVSTGDSVVISIDPGEFTGATISPESQAGYVIDSVKGDENSFNFIFIADATATATATTTSTTTTASTLPASGVGPQGTSSTNGMLMLAVAGSAIAAGAAGVALRKRSI